MTRSSREDPPGRGRQRLQGASWATNLGTKRKLAEGQGTQDNSRPQQGPRRQPVTPTRDREEHRRELRTTEAHGHMEDHPATHPEGQGAQRRRRQRLEVQPGTDQWTRLKRGHDTFVMIEDKQTSTPQGWPHREGREPQWRRGATGTNRPRAWWRAKDSQEA